MDHAARDSAITLDIPSLLRSLEASEVRYVLTGSVAAAVYGVPVSPRDLDIAPDLESDNLARLAGLLRRWNAKPLYLPDWPEGLAREDCERWTPDPPTIENLDHLMTTPYGLFDVVPARSITYAQLVPRALLMDFELWKIRVAHPADLISPLRLNQSKHQERLPHLVAIHERLERGETIVVKLPQ